MIKNFIDNSGIEYYENISLKKYNTYRLNVICDYLVFPSNIDELLLLMKFIKDNNLKYFVLGNGSNVIFKNSHYDGIVIRLDKFNKITFNNTLVNVEAGYSMVKLGIECIKRSLSGFEFASAIPGQVGASIAMNAGAYKSDMASIVKSVMVLTPNLEIIEMSNSDLEFSYRDSFLKKNKGYFVISALLELSNGDSEEILHLVSSRRVKRMESQPLDLPSAGSVFRNPPDMYAGELIENCGLKGYSINGAMVSLKHANFIVNNGNATGEDIVNLINLIKKSVLDKYNVDLVLEQQIIE